MNVFPTDVVGMVDNYRRENNPGNKFLKLLVERKEIYEDSHMKLEFLAQCIGSRHWPIEITPDATGLTVLKIVGELPLISEQELKEIVGCLIESYLSSSTLNWLLAEVGSNFRIIPVAILKDGGLKYSYDDYGRVFRERHEIVEIK